MALQDNEISWHVLRRIVHDWAGQSAELTEVKPLEGGCINTTLALTTKAGDRAVLKISPHRVNQNLTRKAHQLGLLRQIGLPVPQVYAAHLANLDNPDSYFLMEFLDGVTLVEARRHCSPEQYDELQRHLAELVVMMHAQRGEKYCRADGNGAPTFADWPAFFRHVYDPIWHDVEKSAALPVKCRKQIGKVHERLERLIAHGDGPRLVHWDIWATNILAKQDETGRWRISGVLDPNCKFAHAEAELAYMELFHTITPAFMRAYQQDHRLDEGYHRVRKHIYQLYPLIDHVHLFGQDYVKPLMQILEKVAM